MSRALSILLVAALFAATPGETRAQAQERNDLNLPSWSQSSRPAPSQQSNPQRMQPPTPPAPAPQVPLGGLEWLALAGGAYAVKRLRRNGEGDDANDAEDEDALA